MLTELKTPIISGYQIIEQLYAGYRTIVYKGVRLADSSPVVIKCLASEYPTFQELLQFRNQYTIAKNLKFPGIIRTYSLESVENGYILLMEDFGGISLKDYFLNNKKLPSLQEFLQIAISLCDTFDILYHQRVIHKDIKPSNILINPETKEVKLIDFSIASLLPQETQSLKSPNVLEGTLSYLSPEQTGRMNRVIDYRTDFYSLGVTFYELLTGQLPFASTDPMELVHCHIAKMPLGLGKGERLMGNWGEVPQVITDIVIKLMAKNAEDRYQSALGLKHDLQTCISQIENTGKITYFEIAQKDICDRFIIPDKLYGREAEVETLLNAFSRVVNNHQSELMLVAGFSGIGKTAVINEVHKPIVRHRGYFIKGKFDQFNRNVPFDAFVQAFRDLMKQLLTESSTNIQEWKDKILAALGENGQVIIEVIPELECIIGKQNPVTQLSGTAAQSRFNLLFQKFLQVFTAPEHALVLFLDDLQWADSASLKLMQLLAVEFKTSYLLMIGAYRDNEVFAAHPLMLMLDEVRKNQVIIQTINLQPLSQNSLNKLVSDALKCSEKLVLTLTELIYRKTQGNPFFSTQFLKALYEDGFITYNKQGGWECDITQVQKAALTDDVVEFMSVQLQKLPEKTQEIFKLAACIGNQFDLNTLAIVLEKSETETAGDCWIALKSGLVLPQTEIYKFYQGEENQQFEQDFNSHKRLAAYKFLHDRVQQAAYSLIPENQKQATHLKIGQLLLHNSSEPEREEKLFDIVNHFNCAKALLLNPRELEQSAQLNLAAGQKAKKSTAYNAAFEYLQTGIELLSQTCWQTQYDLALSLHTEAAEVAYASGRFEALPCIAETVLNSARTLLDKIKIYEIQIQVDIAQNNLDAAIQTGQTTLNALGIPIPKQANMVKILWELATTKLMLSSKRIPDLVNLPTMQTPEYLAAMQIMSSTLPAIFFGSPKLLPILVLRQVNLSVKQGNTALSAFAYSLYGLILCGILLDIETGYQFGQLAIQVLQKFQAKETYSKVVSGVNGCITHWKAPLHTTITPLKEAYQVGLETGDLESASRAAILVSAHLYYMGNSLIELEPQVKGYAEIINQFKQSNPLIHLNIYRQAIENLLGKSANPVNFTGNYYSEDTDLAVQIRANDKTGVALVYIIQLELCYRFDDFSQAVAKADLARGYEDTFPGFFMGVSLYFYDSLVRLALYPSAAPKEQQKILKRVANNQKKIKTWVKFCPENHLHRYELVEAERYRVLGKTTEAMTFYDQAIASAKSNGFLHEEALASEIAAKFYLDWGREKVAQFYMQDAYYCYAKWGAKAKTECLEKSYPQLIKPILLQQRLSLNPWETIFTATLTCTSMSAHSQTASSNNISEILDLTSVLKAAQTISSNIELDELVTSLTQIILENSGAEKSVLILSQSDTWEVRAITTINSKNKIQTILSSQSFLTCQDIPSKIINYVQNTQELVVIDNCQTNIPGLIGEYMLEHQPKSVLCTPIIDRGNLVGILYLENKITSGVFTQERLQVIKLLSSQAAISLENARLYQQAQQALHNLQQAQLQIVQSEKMSALGNLVAGVAHEMNNPLGFIAATLEQAKPTVTDISEHLKFYQDALPNPGEQILDHAEEIDIDYSLEDLPKMIDAMVIACERLKNISTSLRTFSRADKDHKVLFNIHDGIDSTILILKHRLKANEQRPAIEVETEYANLPQVNCFPGQLNQVFMNILANAIDALDDSNAGRSFESIKAAPNRIIVKTSVDDSCAKISITDNGKGMDADVKQKIFDHLFTTKAVGKGTGLGLAIAKQIIEEIHAGKLICESVVGQGTEFIISIPL